MENTLNTQLAKALNWRYATKRFDPTKRLSTQDWKTLEEALRLSPSSFGLQPWHFVVVNNPDLRQQLRAASWDQPQIVEASHLVVLASAREIDTAYVDNFISLLAQERGVELDKLEPYRQMILGFTKRLTESNGIEAWTSRQTYIALGTLLTSAALLNIDACPIEGIDPKKYDQILGLESSPYSTRVVCALGYRAEVDATAQNKKVRFTSSKLFTYRD
ncbi:MAG: NAD(P)H-dependent oxidoreductase [Pseudomonadota bacterium]|jgi:nitroreductase